MFAQGGIINFSSFERTIKFMRITEDFDTLKPIGNPPLAGQTVRRRFTHIWKKEGDAWRLWARHANVIPAP